MQIFCPFQPSIGGAKPYRAAQHITETSNPLQARCRAHLLQKPYYCQVISIMSSATASPPKFIPPTYEDRFATPHGDARAALLLDPENGGSSNDERRDNQNKGICGCLSVRYYQPYFNVDTRHVTQRLLFALYPFRKDGTTFVQLLDSNPDAYGPFWIATTLIFVIAVISNVSSYFHFRAPRQGAIWQYDFAAVVTCATVIYSFASAVPFFLWLALRYVNHDWPFIQTLTVYGYSLAPFMVLTLLNLIPAPAVPWLSELAASLASGVFLLRALGPSLMEKNQQQAAPILGAIGIVQVALGLTIKLVFFHT